MLGRMCKSCWGFLREKGGGRGPKKLNGLTAWFKGVARRKGVEVLGTTTINRS